MEFPLDDLAMDDFAMDDFAMDDFAMDDVPAGVVPEAPADLCEPETIDDLLDQLVHLDRQRARIAAVEAHLMVRIAGEEARHREVTVLDDASDTERLLDIADEAREEIATALRRPPSVVHDQLVAARLLAGPLARTRDALADGRICEGHAREIAEGAEALHRSLGSDPHAFTAACETLQDRLLDRAERCTRAQLRRAVRAAVAAIDADGERERRRRARGAIDVSVCPEGDGLALLIARLPAVDAARVLAAVNAVAAAPGLPTPCDATLGQRRAAALLALACPGAGEAPGAPVAGAPVAGAGRVRPTVVRAEVVVTVSLADLLDPEGPVSALLDDPTVPLTLRRLVTDPHTGQALDLGRRRYEVSEPLRRWIVARDRTCRFPGCSRRASACQVDHVVAWSDGGRTDADNLHALCTRHHQLKTHAQWQVSRDARTGLTVWTSPTGRTYWVEPDPPPESGSARLAA